MNIFGAGTSSLQREIYPNKGTSLPQVAQDVSIMREATSNNNWNCASASRDDGKKFTLHLYWTFIFFPLAKVFCLQPNCIKLKQEC